MASYWVGFYHRDGGYYLKYVRPSFKDEIYSAVKMPRRNLQRIIQRWMDENRTSHFCPRYERVIAHGTIEDMVAVIQEFMYIDPMHSRQHGYSIIAAKL